MEFVRKYFKYIMIFLALIMIIVLLVMIAKDDEQQNGVGISGGVDIAVMPTTAKDDGKDDHQSQQAIIIGIDTDKMTIVLREIGSNTNKTYTYTGGTKVITRFGEDTTIDQLLVGEVVDVEAEVNNKISSIQISSEDWEYKNVTNFTIDKEQQTLSVGGNKYYYSEDTVIASGDSEIELDKLENIDTVTLRGKEKQLDSIIVTSGHGYVRLDNTTYFEGGFVEIGDKIVELITENMVLPVPVGEYTLTVTKTDTSGSKKITVNENEEIRVNLTDFQSDAVKLGTLSFKITPEGATLYIDGVKKSYKELVDVSYGRHKIVVKADGYQPYSQIIDVEDILKEYVIDLQEEKTTESTETTSKEGETSTTHETTTKKSAKQPTTTSQTVDMGALVNELLQ